MSVDWHGIRTAIATKCGNVSGIVFASADSPDNAPNTPAVLVTHVSGIDMADRAFTQQLRNADVNGVLVVSPSASTAKALENADDLVEGLFVEFTTGIQLGYPGVVQDSWLMSASEDQITVAKVEYEGYRLRWRVVVRESITKTA